MTAQRLRTPELIELGVDEDSLESWDAPPVAPVEVTEEYAAELTAARDRSGVNEAVITGEGTIHGRHAEVLRQLREQRLARRHNRYPNLGLP